MTHHATTPATPLEDTHDFAVHYLRQWVTAPATADTRATPASPSSPTWSPTHRRRSTPSPPGPAPPDAAPPHPALYDGGLAGTLIGLHLGARLHPVLHPAANRLAAHLRQHPPRYRTHTVTFRDYDLISGPAGTLLALCATDPTETADPNGTAQGADAVGAFETAGAAQPPPRALAAHLALLCDDEELPRLRTGHYAGHPHLAWVNGRINTGMGHGVAGVVTALTTALRHTHPDQDPDLVDSLTTALGRATRWLIRQAYDDERGIRTWPAAGLDHHAQPPSPPAPSLVLRHPRHRLGTVGRRRRPRRHRNRRLGRGRLHHPRRTLRRDLPPLRRHPPGPPRALPRRREASSPSPTPSTTTPELPAATPLKHRLVHHLTHHLASHPALRLARPTSSTACRGTLAALLTRDPQTPRA